MISPIDIEIITLNIYVYGSQSLIYRYREFEGCKTGDINHKALILAA